MSAAVEALLTLIRQTVAKLEGNRGDEGTGDWLLNEMITKFPDLVTGESIQKPPLVIGDSVQSGDATVYVYPESAFNDQVTTFLVQLPANKAFVFPGMRDIPGVLKAANLQSAWGTPLAINLMIDVDRQTMLDVGNAHFEAPDQSEQTEAPPRLSIQF